MKISILGCGWLGLPLGAHLVEKGHTIKGATTRLEKFTLLKEKNIDPYFVKAGAKLEGDRLIEFFQSELLIINIPPGRRRPDVEERFPEEVQLILGAAKEGAIKKIIFISSTSVYPNNEKVIMEKLNTFLKNKTAIVIAHRLSTVKNAHQIVVLDEGKIVEIGNHQQLVANKSNYYNLVKNQLELGK